MTIEEAQLAMRDKKLVKYKVFKYGDLCFVGRILHIDWLNEDESHATIEWRHVLSDSSYVSNNAYLEQLELYDETEAALQIMADL